VTNAYVLLFLAAAKTGDIGIVLMKLKTQVYFIFVA